MSRFYAYGSGAGFQCGLHECGGGDEAFEYAGDQVLGLGWGGGREGVKGMNVEKLCEGMKGIELLEKCVYRGSIEKNVWVECVGWLIDTRKE